ncbi:MAG: tetratricopeptide repeat protein [Bacteroidia bacterium]
MENRELERAQVLMSQGRWKEAESILGQCLVEMPEDTEVLSLMAAVKIQQDEFSEAERFIDQGISIDPSDDYLYYMKSRVKLISRQGELAEEWIRKAISLYPESAVYFGFLAFIQLQRKNYAEALETVNHALSINPEDLFALNTRTSILIKLNQKEDAFFTIEGALKEDPNNAYTHTNYGWNLLEHGDANKALEHFKEALKIDPNFELAQAGMAEALKARYFVYRWFMKFQFWMAKLSSKYQWGVILGFYFGTKVIRTLAASSETLAPFLNPLIFLLFIFAFSTWVMTPISNLFLRLNTFGKYLLSKEEKLSSNFVAVFCGLFLIGVGGMFLNTAEWFFALMVYGFTMMIPASGMFTKAKYKNIMLYIFIGLGLIGLTALIHTYQTGNLESDAGSIYLFGFIAYQWLANFLVIKQNNYN